MRALIQPEDVCVTLQPDETLLHAARAAGTPFTSACGGHARCSTCRVRIVEGLEHCRARNDLERAMAEQLAFPDEIRLACQLCVSGDVTLQRLALDGDDIEVMVGAVAKGAAPVGQERRIAILFSDIRGFTSFSEKLPPYDVIHVLNRYFNRMGKIVEKNHGCVDNYIGDGMMALFGIENPHAAAHHAVRAGCEMLAEMTEFKKYLVHLYNVEFDIGIGVHLGDAVVGSIGTARSMRTTAIGDAVNFASRIESANKEAGTRFLVSHTVREALGAQLEIGKTILLPVKGKTGVHQLYEVLGISA